MCIRKFTVIRLELLEVEGPELRFKGYGSEIVVSGA